MPRDFVEFPSQFNEHWALEPERVRELCEALPDRRADAAGAGRQDQAVAHVQSGIRDDGVARGVAARYRLAHAARRQARQPTSMHSRRRRSSGTTSRCPKCRRAIARTYFSHIWDGGYSAGYYAYTWSEVLDDDAFAWFRQTRRADARERRALPRHDSVARRNAGCRRRCIARSAGSDPRVDALLEERGLKGDSIAK